MALNQCQFIIRLLFSLLFAYSAYLKFVDLPAFAEVLQVYDILTPSLNSVAALYVPLLEALLALHES